MATEVEIADGAEIAEIEEVAEMATEVEIADGAEIAEIAMVAMGAAESATDDASDAVDEVVRSVLNEKVLTGVVPK